MTQYVIVKNSDQTTHHTLDLADQAAAEALAEGHIGYPNGTYTVSTKPAWEATNAVAIALNLEENRARFIKSIVLGEIKGATLPDAIYAALSGPQQTELDTYHTDLWALRESMLEPDALVLPTRPAFL